MNVADQHALSSIQRVYASFNEASQAVLQFLSGRIKMDLWMVTRAQGDHWIILQSIDRSSYGIGDRRVLRWSDSFCSRMVNGKGPRIAADSSRVPAYANAPIAGQFKIGSYIGTPLTSEDGSLFGTLCAISSDTKPEAILDEQPLIELFSGLLSTILGGELRTAEAVRQAEKSRADAQRDSLTALFNHRGWKELLAREQDRCTRYGHAACVLSIDLNDLKHVNDTQGHQAGDQLITCTAEVIRAAARQSDIIARLGGDEFVVLAVECDRPLGDHLANRIRARLSQAGISAAIGIAEVIGGRDFSQACNAADADMYADKRRIKSVVAA